MALDPQSLLSASSCFMCYGVSIAQALKLQLLSQIALAHNPAANVTPAALLTAGKCWPCFSNSDIGTMMELELLKIIAT